MSANRATYQYPLYEHVIVLLSELRSAEHKSAQQLYSRLSHTGGVVHQPTMDATLHVRLQRWTRKCQWKARGIKRTTRKKMSLQTQILTYPCQYAGVHSHNLRQTFHGFSPYSDGAFPKDSQDLLKRTNTSGYDYTKHSFFFPIQLFKNKS